MTSGSPQDRRITLLFTLLTSLTTSTGSRGTERISIQTGQFIFQQTMVKTGQNLLELMDVSRPMDSMKHSSKLQRKAVLGFSFTIKNIGNYTAWNVTSDFTVSGGFVFIGKHFGTTGSDLQPGEEITLRTGLILGFGKVMITLRVAAANVKEMSSEKSATLLLDISHNKIKNLLSFLFFYVY